MSGLSSGLSGAHLPASAGAGRRACPRCLRVACVCAALDQPGVPVASAVELLVLQHPRELREPKGTARLLHLAVAGSRLCVGERWAVPPQAWAQSQAKAQTQAEAEALGQAQAQAPRCTLLLYPPTPGDAGLAEPPPLPQPLPPAQALRLVVLDATWRKSRRMLYESPWLQGLPRLALAEPPPSRYHVRRARGAAQRSTFEAAVLALAQLQGPAWPAQRLWPVFDALVARLAAPALSPGGGGAVRRPPAPGPGPGR